MKEPVPHFNEPLSLPPETVTNLKSDQRSKKHATAACFLNSSLIQAGGKAAHEN